MAKLIVLSRQTDENQLGLAPFKSLLNRRLAIPEYQRRYAWDGKNNIRELFETIAKEFKFNPELEVKYDEAPLRPCFLGSIIFCSPNREQEPTKEEYLVIDGQQRIISLLVILRFMLYRIKDFIKEADKEIEGSNEKEKDRKITVKISLIEEEITRYLETVSIRRKGPTDKTLKEEEKIEERIIDYINNEQKRDSIPEIEEDILEHVARGFDDIQKEELNEDHTSLLDQTNFYIQLANHILNHIQFCWLYIQGEESEEYAIDMFNIMNSTGEPLTGFDILKSTLYKIDRNLGDRIDAIGKKVLSFLKKSKNKRQPFVSHTGKLILFLSIYRDDNEGKVVSDKKVIEQKRYIQKICKNKTTSEKICSDLESISDLYVTKWLEKKHPYDKKAGFCFNFLIDLGHDRTLPVLLRFDEESNEIDDAIKTCTAFSVIWRILHDASTGGVDKKYLEAYRKLKDKKPTVELLRRIFKTELSRVILEKYVSFSGDKKLYEEWEKSSNNLEKYPDNKNSKITQEIKLYLKDAWTRKLIDLPIYSKNRRLTRFLILIASNQLTYGEDGSLKRTGGHDLLDPKIYNDKAENSKYGTIDHIIAQKPETEDDMISNVHTLGNLTLLPPEFNSSLRNSNFKIKKAEFEKVIKGHTEDTIPYLPILKEIVYKYKNFGETEVSDRTEILSGLIWDTLVTDWLGWK